ncbi:MAG TPA: signal peptidase I [Candidatus Nanoarchaeia archaeon]|nr:signal peptidase I [Candidatus Nanoarchaeia archaeon]
MNEHSLDTSEQEVNRNQKKPGFWSEIFKFTLITLLIVVPFRLYVAQPFIVSGASMDPTFHDGDYLIVDQISKRFETPKLDEVIIFKYPKDPSKYFIKRVIGTPGDTVEIKKGVVTVTSKEFPEGKTLNEPYIADQNQVSDNFKITLKEGEFFVLGDNRKGSLDSRSWGPVTTDLIVGRPLVRLLPLPSLGVLPGNFSND